VLAGKMGLPTRAVGLVRKPFFAVAALVLPLLPLLWQGIALRRPMGVCPRKFPTGTLAFVGQGCTTGIRQIDHHNIGIGSDTVTDAVFISTFVAGASHLHCRSLSKPSGTHSEVRPQFKLRNPYGLPIFRARMPGPSHRGAIALAIGDE